MAINENVVLGEQVVIHQPDLVNLYGCIIGDHTRIGPFVEIQKNSSVGARCKISSHSFICEGVAIEDEVMIGHGVMFTNDIFPSATTSDRTPKGADDWRIIPTRVHRGASIGSNATLIAGIIIGENALVGAGAVVTTSVPDYAIVAGVPARVIGDTRHLRVVLAPDNQTHKRGRTK